MFLETICIQNGEVLNLQAHIERMQQSAAHHHFNVPTLPDLGKLLPQEYSASKVKCRITYHTVIEEIGFEIYQPRHIASLKLVEASPYYAFKYADRRALLDLVVLKGDCDEILITRNGLITDTSYSNVLLSKGDRFYTPRSFLLNGTKRQLLLREGKISERDINADSLGEYDRIYLINALLGIEDGVSLSVNSIYP